jgi:uncharacterized protein (TIGR02145 family)
VDEIRVYNRALSASEILNLYNQGNSFAGFTNCGDTGSYEGKSYPTVQIGTQCWMAKNMDAGFMVSGATNQTNNNILEKYCYADNTANCDTDGGLYLWAEAVQYLNGAANNASWNPVPSGNVRGICPLGWHIPTDNEQDILDQYLKDAACGSSRIGTWECGNAGVKMKIGGTSGFNGLIAGYKLSGGSSFAGKNIYGHFWSSSENTTSLAWDRALGTTFTGSYRYNYNKTYGFSVRCLKD